MELLDFDASRVFWQLETCGGASFPVIGKELRSSLLRACYGHRYTKRPEEVGSVRQDIFACDSTDHPDILNFRSVFEAFLLQAFDNKGLFLFPLKFNEITLQLYEANSFGITPHRDRGIYQNLICTLSLSGQCRFGVCKNRQGEDPVILEAVPGNVTILRAPGFLGDIRPFHFLDQVKGPRYTIGFRQLMLPIK